MRISTGDRTAVSWQEWVTMPKLRELLAPYLADDAVLSRGHDLLRQWPAKPGHSHRFLPESAAVIRLWGSPHAGTSFQAVDGHLVTLCFCVSGNDEARICTHKAGFAFELAILFRAGEAENVPGLAEMIRALEPRNPERVLTGLDQILGPKVPSASASPAEARPVWAVGPRLEPKAVVLVKRVDRLKRGGWSVPKPVRGHAIGPLLRASPRPQDRAALQVIEAVRHSGWGGTSWEDCVRAALPLLVGHPEVYWGDEPGPVAVVAARPCIHVRADGDDYTVTVLVGNVPLPDADPVVAFDTGSRRLHVGPVSERVRALAKACDDPRSGGVSVPKVMGPRLLERLWPFAEEADFDLAPELSPRESLCDGRMRVAFEREGEAWRVRILVRPLGEEGPSFAPGEGPTLVTIALKGEPTMTRRRLDAERRRAEELPSLLDLELTAPDWSSDLSFDRTLDAASRLSERSDLVVEWPSRKPTVLKSRAKLRVEVGSVMDWFGVGGTAEIDGTKLTLAQLIGAYRQKKRFVEVAPDTFVDVAKVFDQRLEKLAQATREDHGKLVLSKVAATEAPDLLDGVDEVQAGTDWSQLVERVREIRGWEPKLPKKLETTLRDYQLEGFRWMARLSRLGLGALLADDMGLGKTVQAIAMLLERAKGGPALVIAPTSVVFNWQRELARFAPSLKVHLLRQSDRAALLDDAGPNDVVIASWGLVRFEKERLRSRRWHTVVFDEAQVIKTWSTDTAKAARALQADWRLALSGTPVENHLGELYSLMETAIPGLFGGWEGFQRRYAAPIERAVDDEARREAQGALTAMVKPFLLRRRKSQVALELPSRTEVRLDVELSRIERQIYEAERIRAVDAMSRLDDGQDGRFQLLASLTRLRQIASSAHLVDDAAPEESSKTLVLMEQLEELVAEGRASLVFSQFTSQLDLVAVALAKRGIDVLQLTGETPEAERRRRVDAFQKGAAKVFLISLKAGGTGLNLTAADTVFLMDPWWNPAAEDQAADRAHRMGQDKPVTIVRLVARGTIEERVLDLHAKKRGLVDGVLGEADVVGKLSTDDLVDLVRAGGKVEAVDEPADSEQAPVPKKAPKPSKSPPAALAPEAVATVEAAPAPATPTAAQLVSWAAEYWSERLSPGSVQVYTAGLRKIIREPMPEGGRLASRVRAAVDAYARRPDDIRWAHRAYLQQALDAWSQRGLVTEREALEELHRFPAVR
jgi:superfamily II DNA or RNA helicase